MYVILSLVNNDETSAWLSTTLPSLLTTFHQETQNLRLIVGPASL